MFRKNTLAMLVGEFLGTASLTLIVLSISHSQLNYAYFVSAAAGLVVLLMTLALAGISGAVFNPAMVIGLWTVRKIKTLQALAYIVVELLGGAVAWWLFVYFTKLHGVHNSGHYDARILVAEVVGTFVFAFGWASAIYQRFSLYSKAFTIGGSLTAGAFIAMLGSAGFLNPAVALGARSWGWGTYVLGPILGAIIGFNLYNLLFVETELAEVAEFKSEKARTSKVDTSITHSVVAAEVAGRKRTTAAKAKTSAVKGRVTTAKKTAAKRTSGRGRNPNAA